MSAENPDAGTATDGGEAGPDAGGTGTETAADAPATGTGETDTDAPDAGRTAGAAGWLASVRADPARRRAALAAGAVVGLALAWVHWLGFLVGGVLVGLASPTLRRAPGYGLAFGVLGVAVFLGLLGAAGTLGAYAATGQLFYVGLAVPVVAGLVGSLARGVV